MKIRRSISDLSRIVRDHGDRRVKPVCVRDVIEPDKRDAAHWRRRDSGLAKPVVDGTSAGWSNTLRSWRSVRTGSRTRRASARSRRGC